MDHRYGSVRNYNWGGDKMKTKHKIMCLLIACTFLTLIGCAGTPITLKSFPAKDIIQTSSRPISAQACGFQLLLFIPININSRLEQAYSALQEEAGNDKIANLRIEEYWRYAFVGTVYCTRLTAIAYKKAESP